MVFGETSNKNSDSTTYRFCRFYCFDSLFAPDRLRFVVDGSILSLAVFFLLAKCLFIILNTIFMYNIFL